MYAPSTSLIKQVVVITQPTVGMSVEGVPNPGPLGQTVTFTATISAPGKSLTGSVVFLDGGTMIGMVPLTNGSTAVFQTNSLIRGSHTIQAVYSGDANNPSQTATVVEVIKYPAVESLSVSPNPANVGQTVTFTSKIVGTGPAPTGVMLFLDNGSQIGLVPLSANGTAVLSSSSLAVGSHAIQAMYSGDANYISQVSTATETVVAYPPAIANLSATPNPASAGQTVTFTAKITATGPTPTGKVQFLDNGSQIGLVSLAADGTALVSSNTLTLGTHAIQAIYSGDANYASQTATISEVIAATPDYTLSSGSPITIDSLHPGSTLVTVVPLGGLADAISLSCGSVPAGMTCSVTPAQVSVSGGNSQSATVSIAQSSALSHSVAGGRDVLFVACLSPWLFAGLPVGGRRLLRGLVTMLLLIVGLGGLSGCGDVYYLTHLPGSYNVVIQGHGAATGLNRTTTVTLVVK